VAEVDAVCRVSNNPVELPVMFLDQGVLPLWLTIPNCSRAIHGLGFSMPARSPLRAPAPFALGVSRKFPALVPVPFNKSEKTSLGLCYSLPNGCGCHNCIRDGEPRSFEAAVVEAGGQDAG
jgi:hypothetical protein